MFLSDNGIYGVSFQDLYNLRGNDIPLSEAINATIDDINKDYWQNSSAVYFDNRYYIAVPTGSSQNNNKVLVFNFLNKAWESVDSYADSNFSIDKLIIAGIGSKRGVYAVNTLGGVHQLESPTNIISDVTISSIGGGNNTNRINTRLKTRQYNLGTIDRKKWNNYEIVYGSYTGALVNVLLNFELENTDATTAVETLPSESDEGVSIRGRIGNYRAYGAQAIIENNTGAFELKQFKIAGALTFRSLNNTE
jgi:hypothetical protein